MSKIINFHKYQGTGNDFIIINQMNNEQSFELNEELVYNLCHRRFGIGADGLMLLQDSNVADFKMVYFNSDGKQSTMCGNGGRCIVHFAHQLQLFKNTTTFEAIDGLHQASVLPDQIVRLQMNDVDHITTISTDEYELNTGSPHFIKIVSQIPQNILSEGQAIRYNDKYKKEGINVNFLCKANDHLLIATYERGVEDETYSCGTGVTAAALVAHQKYGSESPVIVKTKGGELKVEFEKQLNTFSNIWLIGPAKESFTGDINLNDFLKK